MYRVTVDADYAAAYLRGGVDATFALAEHIEHVIAAAPAMLAALEELITEAEIGGAGIVSSYGLGLARSARDAARGIGTIIDREA